MKQRTASRAKSVYVLADADKFGSLESKKTNSLFLRTDRLEIPADKSKNAIGCNHGSGKETGTAS